uniref:Uncharacterized protein n=1 Tax=Chromera velia CCMP2878 TaxID=1169474 RepID=A0A0G4FQU5_9ALVE|mmetsp:Transcript_38083/g.74822  ORF Transcript_38083/g.74822 Transcript_38083/m.74822 type:complete len:385 (-) Transcript_38083:651-1805(-)|eukprot:Cvel_18227.t1-p1 / transcript=Cvel_18227.t1 / gene=Cvel_18227 / organism=Chromera_velia_CCMP2878 / gene_product=hypothetical protein / transcript_product=hypothetical protein / location=Cvel_scaffold1498:4697-6381(+) / protein_length=384 / sequence_SO=supercontig / SO=protein_coding / is_pseudo=false
MITRAVVLLLGFASLGARAQEAECTDDRSFLDVDGDSCNVYIIDPFLCRDALTYQNSDGVSALTACCVCIEQAAGDSEAPSATPEPTQAPLPPTPSDVPSPSPSLPTPTLVGGDEEGVISTPIPEDRDLVPPEEVLPTLAPEGEGEIVDTTPLVTEDENLVSVPVEEDQFPQEVVEEEEVLVGEDACVDDETFRDGDGDSCSIYTARSELCVFASDFPDSNGRTALEACCACAERATVPPAPFSSPNSGPVEQEEEEPVSSVPVPVVGGQQPVYEEEEGEAVVETPSPGLSGSGGGRRPVPAPLQTEPEYTCFGSFCLPGETGSSGSGGFLGGLFGGTGSGPQTEFGQPAPFGSHPLLYRIQRGADRLRDAANRLRARWGGFGR